MDVFCVDESIIKTSQLGLMDFKVILDTVQRYSYLPGDFFEFLSSLERFHSSISSFRDSIHPGVFVMGKNYRRFKQDLDTAAALIKESHDKLSDLDKDDMLHSCNQAYSWLMQADRLLNSSYGILNLDKKIVNAVKTYEAFRIQRNELQTGDILCQISDPKKLIYIIHDRLFSALKKSRVSHVMLILNENGTIKFVDFVGKGMRYKEFFPRPRNFYIVLRSNLNQTQKDVIFASVTGIIAKHPGYSDSERIGAYLSAFLTRRMPVRNLWNNDEAYFCSEFIDEIYKNIGIPLTPKSIHSNTVLTNDILCSSELEFIGLLYDDSESTRKLLNELAKNPEI
jgi:hypothetical protein